MTFMIVSTLCIIMIIVANIAHAKVIKEQQIILPKIYVINLDRSKDRLEHINTQLNVNNLNSEMLTDFGKSPCFYSVLVEIEKASDEMMEKAIKQGA